MGANTCHCDCCGRQFRARDGVVLHAAGNEVDLCCHCAPQNYSATDEAQETDTWTHVWYGWSDAPMPSKADHLDVWGDHFSECPRMPRATAGLYPYPLRSVGSRMEGTPRDYRYRVTMKVERLPWDPREAEESHG